MFLDESGDHSLTIIDPQYPMFVLGGIIADFDYAQGEMEERVREFKRRLFGSHDVILHTADITRNRGDFEQMKDRAFREHFYAELNELMRGLDYKVVACAIKKDAHLARYGFAAIDPYLLSLDVLVERFCFEVGHGSEGGVILKVRGTGFLRGARIAERVSSLTLCHKRENIAAFNSRTSWSRRLAAICLESTLMRIGESSSPSSGATETRIKGLA